jgi:hypothetical protein
MMPRGFHLRMCDFVCSIVVLRCGVVGIVVLVYDLLQSMFVASDSVVTILDVWVLCSYYWVRDVFRIL